MKDEILKKEPWWKRELKEILAISSTFFVMIILFMLMKKAMLGQYHIDFHAAGTALIGSLILGKVVLIFDNLPIMKKMTFLLNIYRVFLRSLIYLVGFILFSLIEHWIKGLINGDDFGLAWKHAFLYLGTIGFLLSLVLVFIAFLVFNAFWVIRSKYGAGELYSLFFKKQT